MSPLPCGWPRPWKNMICWKETQVSLVPVKTHDSIVAVYKSAGRTVRHVPIMSHSVCHLFTSWKLHSECGTVLLDSCVSDSYCRRATTFQRFVAKPYFWTIRNLGGNMIFWRFSNWVNLYGAWCSISPLDYLVEWIRSSITFKLPLDEIKQFRKFFENIFSSIFTKRES